MPDMVRPISVTSADARMLVVLTVGFLVSQTAPKPVTGGLLAAGLLWAASSTLFAQQVVTTTVITIETCLEPVTRNPRWQTYGRPLAYILFSACIGAIALA